MDSGGWPKISFGASLLRQPRHRLADGVALAAESLRDVFRTLGSEVPPLGSGVPLVSVSLEGADGIFGQRQNWRDAGVRDRVLGGELRPPRYPLEQILD